MKLTSTLVLSVFTAVSLMGVPACDDKKDEKKDDKKDAKKKDEKKEEEKKEDLKEEVKEEAKADEGGDAPAEEGGAEGAPEEADGEGGEGGGGADKVGIPECDEYIEKYGACIEAKAPEATKAAMQDAFKKTVDTWKQAAAGPGKDALAQGCKAALDAVKKTAAGWGCEM
jgi:hypothetical protein